MSYDNDGRYPDESRVLTPYPLTKAQDTPDKRDEWEWLPGTVVQQTGPDEWFVVIDGRGDLAEPDEGVIGDWLYPTCFRDSSELRKVSDAEWEQLRVPRSGEAENEESGGNG